MTETKKSTMSITEEQLVQIYERARPILEEVLPIFADADPFDVGVALQFLLANEALKARKTPKEILQIIAINLPGMMELWKMAYKEVQEEPS